MQKPLLQILARFDIHSNDEELLKGRAYLTAIGTHAWDTFGNIVNHTPDLVYAKKKLRRSFR
jgi:hypothetical protein